jgi:hypothetical protein
MDVGNARVEKERRREAAEEPRRQGWIVPAMEDLGSVTEITLDGTLNANDRTTRGSFRCCCAV